MRAVVPNHRFSLALTCAPVSWARGRWPNVDWINGRLVWFGWEDGETVWRTVAEDRGGELWVSGPASAANDHAWARAVLGLDSVCPPFADEVLERLRQSMVGLRPFAYGSLFEGVLTSIVGQSISVAAAAVTETRLSALFHPGLELGGRRFWPLPRADKLAGAEPELVRRSGVTWRRAEALVALGRATVAGALPGNVEAVNDPDAAREVLRRLPLVGPWTCESALLWGLGVSDAYPTGDVALLRAARLGYGDRELNRAALDRLAEGWRPARGWASRVLWTALLGAPGADGPPANESQRSSGRLY